MSVSSRPGSGVPQLMAEVMSPEALAARQRRARRTAWVVGAVVLVLYLGSIFQGWFYS